MPPPSLRKTCLLVIGTTVFLAVVRAATSRPARLSGPATPQQARQAYSDDVDNEPHERQEAAKRFRASPWSQDDEFHSRENKRLKEFAKFQSISVTSLLDAIDEGMHENWPTPSHNVPNPKVMPCRPRLIY